MESNTDYLPPPSQSFAAQELQKLLLQPELNEFSYLSIGIQHVPTKQSTSIMSCEEWQRKFINENYAPYDPIRLSMMLAEKTDLFVYNEIPSSISRFGREVMQARSKLGIKDGVAFTVSMKNKIHAVMNLGTDSNNINLNRFILHNKSTIDQIFYKGMEVFLSYGDKAIRPLLSDDTQSALSSRLERHK